MTSSNLSGPLFFSESWPSNGTDTFGYPPLETARQEGIKAWRGVRFGDVAAELYFEKDAFDLSRDLNYTNICSHTGKPVEMDPFAKQVLYKSSPYAVGWSNMTRAAGLYVMMAHAPMKDAKNWVQKGLSNSVSLEEARYSSFRTPDEGEDIDMFEHGTLTIAVSYVHKTPIANGLLKANEYQISQLEQILDSLRKHPPDLTKRVRLWTDQALSKSLEFMSERPVWILYGLLPYATFTTASLYSGDKSDSFSMWTACEQILADGGSGCLFARDTPIPAFCKYEVVRSENISVSKTIGDGLAVHRNLDRLGAAIHSGLLDETITYHIADAQMLVKLAYYLTRPGDTVSLEHAVSCNACLHATGRDHIGFDRAVYSSADVYDPEGTLDEDLRTRLNKTRLNWPYPKVRARQGYISWHGMREFLPGAGRLAKIIPSHVFERFVKYSYVAKLTQEGVISNTDCIAISARPSKSKYGYIALLVHGTGLFERHAIIEYSVRLNIRMLEPLHRLVQNRDVSGTVSSHFRHPEFNEKLRRMKLHSIIPISSVHWRTLSSSSNQMPSEDAITKQENDVEALVSMLLQNDKRVVQEVLERTSLILQGNPGKEEGSRSEKSS